MKTDHMNSPSVKNYYIIEEIVHFYPCEYSLYNVNSGETITLLSTASECFLTLLEEQGNIVSRKEMKEKVWGKRGVVVSSNTFYQTILNLRRSLEKAGAGNNIISTYYGKGVSIENSVSVTCQSISECVRLQTDLTSVTLEEPSKQEIEVRTDTTHIQRLNKKNTSNFFIRNALTLFIGNVILLVACLIMLSFGNSLKRDNYFEQYVKTDVKVNNCAVFTEPENINSEDFIKFLKSNKLKCEDSESLYLSMTYPIQRVSVIRCTGHFLPGDECESDFYLK